MSRYTKKQAEEIFKSDILPIIKEAFEQDGKRDIPARSEAWNNFTDSLCRDRLITDYQYNNWSHPVCCNY